MKTWPIIKIILNNIFRFIYSVIVIVVLVGLSPILALLLSINFIINKWKDIDFINLFLSQGDDEL